MRDGFQPRITPMHSPTGVSYANAWKVGEACWRYNAERRITMPEAFHLLESGEAPPTVVAEDTIASREPAGSSFSQELLSVSHLDPDVVSSMEASSIATLGKSKGIWKRASARISSYMSKLHFTRR